METFHECFPVELLGYSSYGSFLTADISTCMEKNKKEESLKIPLGFMDFYGFYINWVGGIVRSCAEKNLKNS